MMERNYPPGHAFVEGRFVPMSEAKISVLDWGFLRSDATYDVVHCWEGRFFRLDAHLDRFYRSAEKIRLEVPYAREELAPILAECVRRAGEPVRSAGYVEMIVTRGVSPTFSRDPRDALPTFIAFAIPLGFILQRKDWARGLDVRISPIRRIPSNSVDPTVKNYHWQDLVQGLYDAYEHGAENVILTDLAGNLTEGPGFNVFVVKNGSAATPAEGVLEGISRDTALRLCRETGVAVEKRAVSPEELHHADEAFITSTAGGIMPLGQVDGRALPNCPGPLTLKLHELYWKKHHDPEWAVAVDELHSA